MTWLGKLFCYIRDIFEFLGRVADDISVWMYDFLSPWLGHSAAARVSDFFWDMGTFFYDVRYYFDKVAIEVDYWWAVIESVEIKLQSLWNDLYGTFTDLLTNAYDWAWSAYNWAQLALEKAEAALTEIPGWILTKLDTAYNLAASALQEVPAWIRAGLDSVNSSLDSLWDYAQTTVWNKAVDAWNRAVNAWNYINTTIIPGIADLGTDLKSLWDYAKTTVWNKAVDAWNKAANAFAYAAALVDSLNTTLRTWVLGQIEAAIAAFLATIAAPINLINFWFNDIQNFFNDPLGWLWGKFADWFLGPEK